MAEQDVQETRLLLELELGLTEKERVRISKEIEHISDTPFLVAPEPQIAKRPDFQYAIALEPIVPNLIVLALSTRDIISIVKILLEMAKGRKKGRQDVDVKMGSGSIKIRSDFPVDIEVAVGQIRASAKIVSKAEVPQEIDRIKARQLDKGIQTTRDSIERYEKFVRDFPGGRDLNQWQKGKLKSAEKSLEEYRDKLRKLEVQKLSSK